MSRRARLGEDEKAKWSMIKQWTLLRGYSAYRAQQAVPPGTLVIVMHQRLADDGTDLAHPERHPLLAAQTLLRRLLLEGAGDSSTNQPLSMPPLILVLDVSELAPNEKVSDNSAPPPIPFVLLLTRGTLMAVLQSPISGVSAHPVSVRSVRQQATPCMLTCAHSDDS